MENLEMNQEMYQEAEQANQEADFEATEVEGTKKSRVGGLIILGAMAVGAGIVVGGKKVVTKIKDRHAKKVEAKKAKKEADEAAEKKPEEEKKDPETKEEKAE